MDAIELLKQDHAKVKELFQKIEVDSNPTQGKTLFGKIYHELSVHAIIEEQVFYPSIAKYPGFSGLLQDAYKEHAEAKRAMGEISNLESGSPEWRTKVEKLHKDIEHHVKDEEEKLFPKLQEAMSNTELTKLGAELKEAKTSKIDSTLLSMPLSGNQPTA